MRLLCAAIACLCLSVDSPANERGFSGEVTASQLNLRAGPGEAYQRVATLERGARVVVVGRHANNPTWYQVEVPQGYEAWVYGRFLTRGQGDTGRVVADRLQIRPLPSTKYHQLAGVLRKGEVVQVRGLKENAEGRWYKIRVPVRVPLYAHQKFLKNVGPASLAREAAKKRAPGAAKPGPLQTESDKEFLVLEPEVRAKLQNASASTELEPLEQAVNEIDSKKLSLDNRERRVRLLADIYEQERKLTILELKTREQKVRGDLDAKLKKIERDYRKRLAVIRQQHEQPPKKRYIASGIVEWAPDLFGRWPEYRLVEGGKLRHFLIAPDYDLSRFTGKRVGVSGITDTESGTGHKTVIVKRIEILGTE